jgi:hypothetical protein
MGHTVNRKKEGKQKATLEEDILHLLEASSSPLATQDIANRLQRPWHSIQTRCLMLQIKQKVMGFRVGRINLWQKAA